MDLYVSQFLKHIPLALHVYSSQGWQNTTCLRPNLQGTQTHPIFINKT